MAADFLRLEKLPRAEDAWYKHVSRNNAPTCLGHTRDELLKSVDEWLSDTSPSGLRMFWVSGIAGIGKSTIAQTVAVRAGGRGQLGATFFFSRQEKQRRTADLVCGTIAYHLSLANRFLKTRIAKALENNPNAGSEVIASQFEKLISEPLCDSLNTKFPILIVIDALDECQEQGMIELLGLFTSDIYQLPPNVKIFITSRPEGHIRSTLEPLTDQHKPERPLVLLKALDTTDKTVIRVYLQEALSLPNIQRVFPNLVGWELGGSELDGMVDKTEGLFIVAATVVKYVMDEEYADPQDRVAILLKEDTASRALTHSAIDYLYLQIITNKISATASDHVLERFRTVIGTVVLSFEPLSSKALTELIGASSLNYVTAALHQLNSVVASPDLDYPLRPQHPSFPDFITDSSRCEERFFVDAPKHHSRLAGQCLKTIDTQLSALFSHSIDSNIKTEISAAQKYSCCFWDDHLSRSSPDDHPRLLQMLREFLPKRFTCWLGALHRVARAADAIPSMIQAQQWLVSLGSIQFQLSYSDRNTLV